MKHGEMAAKKQTPENRIGKGKPGPGRPKGVPNKNTTAIKDMILQALHAKGGAKYLEKQADANPSAFLALVGKVLPTQLTGKDDGPIEFADVTQDAEAVDRLIGQLATRSTEPRPTVQ